MISTSDAEELLEAATTESCCGPQHQQEPPPCQVVCTDSATGYTRRMHTFTVNPGGAGNTYVVGNCVYCNINRAKYLLMASEPKCVACSSARDSRCLIKGLALDLLRYAIHATKALKVTDDSLVSPAEESGLPELRQAVDDAFIEWKKLFPSKGDPIGEVSEMPRQRSDD